MEKRMKTTFLTTLFLATLFLFTGCTKYYYTSHIKHEIPVENKKIPVKIEVTQSNGSIIVNSPINAINIFATEAVLNNPIFTVKSSSTQVIKIDIQHSNNHPGAELIGAMITGASLYIVPSKADSDVKIIVSTDGITNEYNGELVITQGLASSSFIDNKKYTEGEPEDILRNLIMNAVDEFTLVYLKNKSKTSL